MNYVELELTLNDIRSIALALLEDSLRDYAASLNSAETPLERAIILIDVSQQERIRRLREKCQRLSAAAPERADKLTGLEDFLRRLEKPSAGSTDANAARPVDLDWLFAVHKYTSVLRGTDVSGDTKPWFRAVKDATSKVTVERSAKLKREHIAQALERELRDAKFVAAVMDACMSQRAQTGGACSLSAAADEIALEKAYDLLDHGVRLPKVIKPLYKSARRQPQTYLSFADPGPGHLRGTVRESELLAGTIVHIEWIDRDNVDDKSVVEAYRLPALRSAARVRLHVGDETPCSVFIGRPVFEGAKPGQWMEDAEFNKALLKAAHTTAGTCSSMFALGVVDCKVAMDGLTTAQAVEFMNAVAGNVIRDPGVQMLSAAFNINTPLREDRPGKEINRQPWLVVNNVDVARLGIELVLAGRFDKVAWDGASNRQPSLPIISQLTMPKLLELVHHAHEKGLETYISAGLEPEHMRWAVYAGVGGVGIGTSLHHVNPAGRVVGEIHRERVLRTLEVRNAATGNTLGKAAAALARLDWRAGEGSLSTPLDEERQELFNELLERMPVLEGRLHEAMALAAAAREDKAGMTTASKHEKLESRLDEWSNLERTDDSLDALLTKIADLEAEEKKKAEESTYGSRAVPALEFLGSAGIMPFALHPSVERAERTLALYDSKEESASLDKWDDEMLKSLRTALKNGRIDLLNDLFAKYDERRLY